jgi:hypothetical protein
VPDSFDPALEIDDAELLAQLPMRRRFKLELARLSLAADDPVIGLSATGWNVWPRDVANAEHQIVEAPVDFGERLFACRYLIAQSAHLKTPGLALLGRHASEFL